MWIPAIKWLTDERCEVMREFRLPWGICDLVGLEWINERVSERWILRQRRPISPLLNVAVLQALPDKASDSFIRPEEISARLEQPLDAITRALASLARGRFVQMTPDGSFIRTVPWAPLFRRIIALELKLDRVDEAIAQAHAHLGFATASFVGFPEELANRLLRSGRARDIESAGLGLLSVTRAGARAIMEPSSDPSLAPDPVLQMYAVERFWRLVKGRRA